MENNNKKDFCSYVLRRPHAVLYIDGKMIAYCEDELDKERFIYNINCMNEEQHRLNEPFIYSRFHNTRMIDIVMNTILDIAEDDMDDLFMDKLRCLLAEDIITRLKATDPKSLPTYLKDHLNRIESKLKQLN